MGTTIKAQFKTRRDAEMAVERLVQERGIARTDIFVDAASDRNTAGTERSGADKESGPPGTSASASAEGRPALAGAIEVSVAINGDDGKVVEDAFREFGGRTIAAA